MRKEEKKQRGGREMVGETVKICTAASGQEEKILRVALAVDL